VGGVSPIEPPDSGLNVNGADSDFMKGNMAMLMSGTWDINNYKPNLTTFHYDSVVVPKMPGSDMSGTWKS